MIDITKIDQLQRKTRMKFKDKYIVLLDHPHHATIGRGTHFTKYIDPYTHHIISIIWDEDDDKRIFEVCDMLLDVIEEIKVIGERKAHVSLIGNFSALRHLDNTSISVVGDEFNVSVSPTYYPDYIIHAPTNEITKYFDKHNLINTI